LLLTPLLIGEADAHAMAAALACWEQCLVIRFRNKSKT